MAHTRSIQMSWQPRSPRPYPGRSHTAAGNSSSNGAAASGIAQPLLDRPEVVRSPNAAAGRAPTAFTPEAPVSLDSFRMRPKPSLPTSRQEASGHTHNPAYAASDARGGYYPNPGLSIRTSLTPRGGKSGLLATPFARRFRGATYATVRLAVAAGVLVLLALMIVLRRTFSHERALERTLAACLPTYPTLLSASSGGDNVAGGIQSDHDTELPPNARPSIAMVTVHDSRKSSMPSELAGMTGAQRSAASGFTRVSGMCRLSYSATAGVPSSNAS